MLARVVHAPQRADPRLRMGVRRRESARSTPGRLWRVYKSTGAAPATATVASSSASSRSCCSTSPGGSTGRTPTGRTSSGRLPRPRQHRRLRPARSLPDRRPPRTGGRHRAGWACTASTCCDRARAGPREPAYEDVASKFFEHFVYICRAMNRIGGETTSCGTTRTASSTTCCTCPDGRPIPLRCARWSASSRSSRSNARARHVERSPASSERMRVVPRRTGPSSARTSSTMRPPAGTDRQPLPRPRRRATAASVLGRMLDENEFLSPYGIRSLSRVHRDSPASFALDGTGAPRRLRARPSPTTGMFGGNSNWRGPIWFPVNFLLIRVAPEATTASTATTSRSSARPARASWLNLDAVAAGARAAAHPASSSATPTAGAPSSAATSASTTTRTGATSSCSTSTSTATTARARRQPPDRLDRPRRQADPALRLGHGRGDAGGRGKLVRIAYKE